MILFCLFSFFGFVQQGCEPKTTENTKEKEDAEGVHIKISLQVQRGEEKEGEIFSEALKSALESEVPPIFSGRDEEKFHRSQRLKGTLLFAIKKEAAQMTLGGTLEVSGEDLHGGFKFFIEETLQVLPEEESGSTERFAKTFSRQVGEMLGITKGGNKIITEVLTHPSSKTLLLYGIRESARRDLKPQTQYLRALLTHPDDEVLLAALAALARLRDKKSVSLIRGLLRSKKGEKVAQAVFALGDIGGTESRVALEEVAEQTQGPLSELAKETLRQMLRRETREQQTQKKTPKASSRDPRP